MKNKNTIVMMNLGDGVVSGFGYLDGIPAGSCILSRNRDDMPQTQNDLEKMMKARLYSQVIEWQKYGKKRSANRKRMEWDIVWVDPQDVMDLVNNGNKPVQIPLLSEPIESKPKIYEVVDDGNGLRLIKHDKELLDEDEAKIKLFETAVNGGK